jgi:hypothetical protein
MAAEPTLHLKATVCPDCGKKCAPWASACGCGRVLKRPVDSAEIVRTLTPSLPDSVEGSDVQIGFIDLQGRN